MKHKPLITIFAVAAGLALALPARAQTIKTWTGGNGDFFDPTHWDVGTAPGVTDIALINNGSTATIAANSGTNELGAIRLGNVEGGTESGHVKMDGGLLKIGYTAGDPKAVIGFSATLSTFIMNGGTILFDGPDLPGLAGSTSGHGVNELDWEVGEKGLGRFEMHNDAVFRAADDLKIAENASGNGSCLIDGNAQLSVGSGISISGGAGTNEQTMVIAGNSRVEAGNSMGAGNPQGHTDEGYLTMAFGGSRGRLTIQDNAVLNIRRLTAREGTSIITVKNKGQFHIFDVLHGKGFIDTNTPPDRPAETGPNSSYASLAPSDATLTLQDDAQMTVNSDPLSGPTKGLAISGPRDPGNSGGTAILIVRDRASFRVEQDLALGTGAADTSDGILEVIGPDAKVSIGGNLSMAVDLDGNATPGKGTLSVVITGTNHAAVNVTGAGRIANGHLKVTLSGYSPAGGETYTILRAGSFDGQFLSTNPTAAPLVAGLSWQVEYRTDSVVLKVTGTPLGPRVITVTTTNNAVVAGQTNLTQAIQLLQDGDVIRFNISGSGPHYLQTPANGYPRITKNNVTIDGYSQPGAVPNTNPILAPNNAQIKIVLDSRNGNFTDMAYEPGNPNAGFGPGEVALLGIFNATNVHIQGFCFLGDKLEGHYAVAIARDYSNGAPGLGDGAHVSGCWIGVDLDRTNVFGFADGVAAFRHRDDSIGNQARLPSNGHIIGVKAGSANPRAEFNVIVGGTLNLILEGQRHRISGNFLGVLPSGTNDYIVAFADPGRFAESHIEIGRGGSDLVIGTDGDGVNDADERNVMGGVVTDGRFGSFNLGGYRHVVELYSLSGSPGPERTNIKIAGNYVGVGVDGVTRFTNGVPAFNGSAIDGSQYWVGSDFDGVSDAIEANVVFNNYPPGLFYDSPYTNSASSGSGSHGFFDEPSSGALYSVRGNVTVNNYPFPVNPGRDNGAFLTNYINKAVLNPSDNFTNLLPVISTSSTTAKLIGTVPAANTNFPWTIIDLYLPDPAGLINGLVAPDPNLPNGWVQGLTYLGSFVDNGVLDLNTNAGAFEFDISSLTLAVDTKVTVSANYSKDPPGTHNGRTMTALFSYPVMLPQGVFVPGGAESVGLTHVVPDRIIFNTGTANLDNWEPYISVLGTSTFLIEANTFADDATFLNQRFALAFQPATGGNHNTGEVFYADNGTPYRGQVNGSRQNGNPGRVAGDKRPGAVSFIAGGEASPFNLPAFQSDSRWSSYAGRYIASDGQIGRYGTVQTYSLNPSTLTQTPLTKAFDAISGRITAGAPANLPEVSRFGGDLAALDNGNFVVVVDDRSGYHDPARAAVAVIIRPDGSIVKETLSVDPNQIWSNVAAHKGGFCVRVGANLHFFDNDGTLQGQATVGDTGVNFDTGRGDATRIEGHINSPYVYLAGNATTAAGGTNAIRLAAFDSRTRTFAAATNVSELTAANGGSDPLDFLPDFNQSGPPDFDRVTVAADALDRVAVAYEAAVTDFLPTSGGSPPVQTTVRVLKFDGPSRQFQYLTHSFFPFANNGSGFRTFRPSVAMTTRQICIAAKGEINSTNNPSGEADTLPQTTFYTVIGHPDPQNDPTPPAGVGNPTMAVSRSGSNLFISWPSSFTGFVVQSSDGLSPINWANVTPPPPIVQSGGFNTATIAIGTGTKFYRLRQ